MDPITTSAVIGAGANLVGGLFSSGANYKLGKKQLEWQKYAQNKTWEREDNAVQRRAADLNAAGFNKLLAAGSSAQASSPIHVDAPEAPDLSGIGNPLLQYYQAKMAVRKQDADVAQTKAQTELLRGQLATVSKNNELLQRTLDWYKDHPASAPNIPGMSISNTSQGIADYLGGMFTDPNFNLINRTASRIGEWIGEKTYNLFHPNRPQFKHYDKQEHRLK